MLDLDEMKELLTKLEAARAAGLPASTVNGCSCDFCTGKKKWEDNWCALCTSVRLESPKHWENLDMCDECEKKWRTEIANT